MTLSHWMHRNFVAVLCSGSSGNSFLISSQDGAVLVDAGMSCRELEKRMSIFGEEPSGILGVVLTHEHTDHTRGARKFCLEHEVPLYGTRGTLALTPHEGNEAKTVAEGKSFKVGDISFTPFKVRHLAAEPVAYSITLDSQKVSIASDLGCVTSNVVEHMRGSNLLVVEANYDEEMLLKGSYPDFLKRAIKSDHGHLSNDDAGALAGQATTSKTDEIVLVHLSKENNTPEKARGTVEDRLKKSKHKARVNVTEHGSSSGPHSLG